MTQKFETLKQHKADNNQDKFNQVLEELLPRLQKYIEHRIKVYEAKGWLPKNFYATADVLTDIYMTAFIEFERLKNVKDLKVRVFSLADQIIGEYAAKENKILKSKKLPVEILLKEELKFMYEDLTADADGELLLVNDLKDEDISYQQDDFKPKVYLFDFDTQNAFAQSLGLKADDFRDEKLRSLFGSIYSQLPETIRRVLDLNAMGGLNYDEIATIIGVNTEEIEKIIISVQNTIKV